MSYVIVVREHDDSELKFGRFGKFGIETLMVSDWTREDIESTLYRWYGQSADIRFEDTDIGTIRTVGVQLEWQVHKIANA